MRIISGKYGRRRFDVPTNITARPTTDMARENLFNVLNNIVDFEGMTALDLFSGTGAISFELLSRGCASVTSVEKASTQYNFISKVKSLLKEENLVQIRGDVFKFIATCTRKFDLIFAGTNPQQQDGQARHANCCGTLTSQRLQPLATVHPATGIWQGAFFLF